MTEHTSIIPSGSWVAMVTPMDSSGQLDLAATERLVRRHIRAGTQGLVIAGTTGESATLEDADYALLLNTCVAAADSEIPVMAGIGSASTARSMALADLAAEAGARLALAVTPYYLRTTQAGLIAHFETLARHSTLPVVLYNVPGRTGIDMQPQTTAALARNPRIVGIKEAVGELARVRALASLCGPRFGILSGDDESCLQSMENGACGVISVTANVLPEAMRKLCDLCAIDSKAAHALQLALAPIHTGLMREPNPIPVKGVMCKLGQIQDGLRLPLVKASNGLVDDIVALMERLAID